MILNWIDSVSTHLYIPILQSGRSAARLAHLLWEQRVVSSNPTAPTTKFLARIGMSARSSTG